MSETEGTSTVVDEEKTPQPQKVPHGRPPFRLRFSLTRELGRSNLSPSHPFGLGNYLYKLLYNTTVQISFGTINYRVVFLKIYWFYKQHLLFVGD